ncbi:MAG: phosphate signaling complex protein PhoU [Clostridia bacterium]|nr:phosphate signaling complex protein PhoU [Clostridia bacterium]
MTARIEFQREIDSLHQLIIRMGAAVEKAIGEAIEALINLDAQKAERIIEEDDIIDNMECEINHQCVMIISRQQPVARDLRDVTSALKLITDLERIADHASDMSERTLALCKLTDHMNMPHHLIAMVNIAQDMIHGALEAYIAQDEQKAKVIIDMDEKVDEYYESLKAYLINLMKEDKKNIDQSVEMLLFCKYVERIADHAQNVAEWVIFYLKGRYRHE